MVVPVNIAIMKLKKTKTSSNILLSGIISFGKEMSLECLKSFGILSSSEL